jgi:murein DD-endopeptidase MepM/ murein hydrolase activator NlpD
MRKTRKTSTLRAVFSRILRLSPDKEYLLHVQWQDRRSSVSRPVSTYLLRALAGVALFLTIGLACAAWEGGRWALNFARYHFAASRHAVHLSELHDIRLELKSVESSLDFASNQEQRMRALYGINYPLSSPEIFGVGGRSHPDAGDAALSRGLQENLFHTELKGRQLQGRIEHALRNFNQIREFMDYRHNLWDHTPSVLPALGNLSSGFGYRVHPVYGRYIMHKGIDISGSRWTPVYATANGVITVSEPESGYGNLVVIDHGNGYKTKYGHLNRISVRKGEIVKRFDRIGYMGNTGLATGVHVHYEVVRDGDPVNPKRFILPSGIVVD